MCPWVSIDEFVDLRMAAYHSLPLGPGVDIATRQHSIDFVGASQRKSLGCVQSLAALHGLTLKVRGRVDVESGSLPTQFLLRSADGSIDVAIEGIDETGYWLRGHRLAKGTREEAAAILEVLADASATTRRAGRL